MHDSESPINRFPNACPCCGYATLDKRGDWDICSICWWEDDGTDNHNANHVSGGSNAKLSLTRARINFITDAIFSPSRMDLRKQQQPTRLFKRQRQFLFDASDQTVRETAFNWSTSLVELDDIPKFSRFKIGDSVVYRRRNLDSTSRIGTIETVQWNSNIEIWHYRLLDEAGNPIEKWFAGSRLAQNAG